MTVVRPCWTCRHWQCQARDRAYMAACEKHKRKTEFDHTCADWAPQDTPKQPPPITPIYPLPTQGGPPKP